MKIEFLNFICVIYENSNDSNFFGSRSQDFCMIQHKNINFNRKKIVSFLKFIFTVSSSHSKERKKAKIFYVIMARSGNISLLVVGKTSRVVLHAFCTENDFFM
jgi:hypothetical protein